MGTTDPLPARVREVVAENESLKWQLGILAGWVIELTAKVENSPQPEETPAEDPTPQEAPTAEAPEDPEPESPDAPPGD